MRRFESTQLTCGQLPRPKRRLVVSSGNALRRSYTLRTMLRTMLVATVTLLLAAPTFANEWMVIDPGQGAVPLSSGSTGASGLSGLTWIDTDQYYAVADNGARMFPMTIDVNAATGRIDAATINAGINLTGTDLEGIAFHPPSGHVIVSDETGPQIRIHAIAGGALQQTLVLPPVFANIRANLSLEALTWDDANGFLWTANEEALTSDGPIAGFDAGTVVRLQRFDATFAANGQWAYVTDPLPGDIFDPGRDVELSGVVALVALPDGELLVLERALGAGAVLRHRLYQVDFTAASDTSALPALDSATFTPTSKNLLWSRVVLATNLEGAALGPLLDDGSRSLVLISDNGAGLQQALYPLTLRPVVCGDGYVGPNEACDDGNLINGDGCSAACVVESCGDGVINNSGNEACDDGNFANGDGCTSTCAFERPARSCQETIAKAARAFAEGRLKILQACRNQLNKGRTLFLEDGVTPLAGPAQCVNERRVAPKLSRAATKSRAAIDKKCTAPSLAALAACADSIDGLVTADGTAGCLIDSHRLATDSILADQYGDPVPAQSTELRKCQEAIAKSGYKFARAVNGSLQKCRNQFNRGKAQYLDAAKTQRLFDPATCAAEVRTTRTTDRAAAQLRYGIARACTDAHIATLASACATTIDGLIDTNGDGCLAEGHRDAVEAMIAAQYRPSAP